MTAPEMHTVGRLEIVKELFTSIITRLEMLAVHMEKVITEKTLEVVGGYKPEVTGQIKGQTYIGTGVIEDPVKEENDCNS